MEEIFGAAAAVLTSIGTATVILMGFAAWLGKLWTKRIIQNEKGEFDKYLHRERAKFDAHLQSEQAKLDSFLESHKARLSKSQFTFQKEFEAASELSVSFHSFLPEHDGPEMEFYDACDEMARNFGYCERVLRAYQGKHGAVLAQEHTDILMRCIYLAGSNKYKVIDEKVHREANDAAEEIYDKLETLKNMLVARVYGQVVT
jgi:hypothetical protein